MKYTYFNFKKWNDQQTYTVNGVKYKTTWQNGACVSITKA